VSTGILSLYYNDNKVGEGRIKTQPGGFRIAGEGVAIGRDVGELVTKDYPGEGPWRFTGGTIKRVAVDVRRPVRRSRTRGASHAHAGVTGPMPDDWIRSQGRVCGQLGDGQSALRRSSISRRPRQDRVVVP
jgi:hypothetical protein